MQKPGRNAVLNKSHPLTKDLIGCWLCNEGTGNLVHDYSGNNLVCQSDVTLHHAAGGINTNAGVATRIKHDSAPVFQTIGDRSVVFVGSLVNTASTSYFICVLGAGETEDMNYTTCFRYHNSSGWKLGTFWEHGAGNNVTANSNVVAPVSGRDYSFGATISVGATSTVRFYANGLVRNAIGGLANASGGTASDLCILSEAMSGMRVLGISQCLFFFSRVLSHDEMRYLHSNPYCMFN